jgi:phage-related protein
MAKAYSIVAIFSAADRLTAPLRGITSSMERFTNSVNRAGIQTGAMVRRADAIRGLKTSFGDVSRASEGLTRSIKNIGLATAGLGVVGAFGVKKFTDGIISTSSQFEDLAASMTTSFEGNSTAAKGAMSWVSDFARKTPYEIDEVTKAFVKMRTYGIDPIGTNALKITGDVAAAMGRDLASGVEALSDALMGQNMRLKEFSGIDVDVKGNAATLRWQESGKWMTRTIDKNNKALIQSTILELWSAKKFAGAMERRSKTWSGIVSNMADTWTRFNLGIGEAGFFPAMKKRLEDLYNVSNKFMESDPGKGLIADISKSLTTLTDAILPNASTIESVVGSFSGWLKAFDPSRISAFADTVKSSLGKVWDWLKGISFEDVTSFFGDLNTVVGGVASAFRILGGATKGAFDWIDKVTGGKGNDVLGWLGAISLFAASPLGKLTIGLGNLALKALKFVAVSGLVTGIGSAFAGVGKWVLRAGVSFGGLALANPILTTVVVAAGALAYAAYDIYTHWDEYTGKLERLWSRLKEWSSKTWTAISDWAISCVEGLVGGVTNWFKRLKAEISKIDWLDLGKSIMSSMFDGMKNIGSGIKGWFGGMFSPTSLSGSGAFGYQPPGADVGRFIEAAARQYGANADTLKKLAFRESGYKSAAINTWDSNAKKGTPSAGMFQFIRPTFDRFYDLAKKQNPSFLSGLGEKNWLNWQQQAGVAAWAITHGKASHWSTYRGEPVFGDKEPARQYDALRPSPSQKVNVANQIDINVMDNRATTVTRTKSNAPTATKANVGVNRAGKSRQDRRYV